MVEVSIGKDTFGRLAVHIPYNSRFVAKIKAVEGRRWHPADKHWSFPDKEDILEKILGVFDGEKVNGELALQTNLPKTSSRDDGVSRNNPHLKT
jgi:hypothetical protein